MNDVTFTSGNCQRVVSFFLDFTILQCYIESKKIRKRERKSKNILKIRKQEYEWKPGIPRRTLGIKIKWADRPHVASSVSEP